MWLDLDHSETTLCYEVAFLLCKPALRHQVVQLHVLIGNIFVEPCHRLW